ncbi:MAG TPA: flagellar basal body rod C-terminal domain-containing protein [Smithellaceae bacterium]|jgi:flagellar basal-body rod protein FlgC|nr:flagellar basal body rod C-terminal domain-containing protein [Smithellaceae bacterium]HQG80258.1 flagellar basal body rod C-terminal domain-containing protein [Smithellaceae bacterium]
MSTSFNIALSALRALDIKMDVNAHNIANVNTDGFKRSRAHMLEEEQGGIRVTIEPMNEPGLVYGTNEKTGQELESSNVNLAHELVDQMIIRYAFEANVLSIKTADKMQQTLLDLIG